MSGHPFKPSDLLPPYADMFEIHDDRIDKTLGPKEEEHSQPSEPKDDESLDPEIEWNAPPATEAEIQQHEREIQELMKQPDVEAEPVSNNEEALPPKEAPNEKPTNDSQRDRSHSEDHKDAKDKDASKDHSDSKFEAHGGDGDGSDG